MDDFAASRGEAIGIKSGSARGGEFVTISRSSLQQTKPGPYNQINLLC